MDSKVEIWRVLFAVHQVDSSVRDNSSDFRGVLRVDAI